MLLTITTTVSPATDLGFLLHKHPDRVQRFEQSVGTAWVFYPEASPERCTAALLLEVDPVALAKNNRGDGTLGKYVNDRPYVASSLLAVALGDVFRTARSGRCNSRQELADSAISLEIHVPAVKSASLASRMFEPLGWTVDVTPIPLDEALGWDTSPYGALTLTGTVRLADALNHLYVLLPVLDDAKHYWVASAEVEKLLSAGETWLSAHPEQELIARRYLRYRSELSRDALDRLAEVGEDVELEPPVEEEVRVPLNVRRRDAVVATIKELGATSVIDLGCGSGQLLAALAKDPAITKVTGVDVSVRALEIAAKRKDRLPKIEVLQSALTYTDARFAGYDAAVLMEVIEHVDPPRLPALANVVFGHARPKSVIVTTPNSEYNVRYEGLTGMRHPDHRFEWTRAEFGEWSCAVAEKYGYRIDFRSVGDEDAEVGPSTQMGVFTRD